MIAVLTNSWLPAIVPIVGFLLGLLFWSRPDRLKLWSITVSLLSLLAVVGTSGRITGLAEGPLLLYLLPLAACASLLGQPVHRDHRLAWCMTLLFLGLGAGVLTSQQIVGQLALVLILALITFLLYLSHSPLWPASWWGIGIYCLGIISIALSMIADSPASSAASLLTCAILLPLMPFHSGYVAALTRLPGNLPSFITLLLPAIGLHGLVSALPTVPDAAVYPLTIVALGGALYGSVKAMAQSRVRLLLVYFSLAFFSNLWLVLVVSRTVIPQAVIFLTAVGLTTGGLLIAWQVVRTRYGDDVDPRAVSDLAWAMPRFAVLLSLLAVAAMGLPPFGVFAGFMGMLLHAPMITFAFMAAMVAVWLAASWYILDMVQQLLFGRQRPEFRHADLRHSEFVSLLMIVLMVIALGIVPAGLFGIESQPPYGVAMESISWKR